jgi:hypothetical protein
MKEEEDFQHRCEVELKLREKEKLALDMDRKSVLAK